MSSIRTPRILSESEASEPIGGKMIETAAKSRDRLYAYTAYGFLAWAHLRADNCADSEKDSTQAQSLRAVPSFGTG
jgi:hypothetical protein